MKINLRNALFAAICFGLLAGCASIAPYDQQAYNYAVQLKVDSLNLLAEANDPYSKHADEIQQLDRRLEIAYQYAKGRPNNSLSTRQWAMMNDPAGHLLGGTLQRWKKDGRLNPAFIKNESALVSDGFDQIIGLESGKLKPDASGN
ncbi:MAG: hypothetical protein PVI37_00415 [Gammaproteobacteria bacterium]|jgi:hypothetical protein